MKKITALFATICLCFVLCSCGDNSKQAKLQGYYENPNAGLRYRFEITELAKGEYGGELTDMEDTTEISAWYIQDSILYINGDESYFYTGEMLLSLTPDELIANNISIDSNGIVSGTTKRHWISTAEITFNSDGTISYRTYNPNFDYWGEYHTGKYTFDNNYILVYDNSDRLRERWYVFDGYIYDDYFWQV